MYVYLYLYTNTYYNKFIILYHINAVYNMNLYNTKAYHV